MILVLVEVVRNIRSVVEAISKDEVFGWKIYI